MVTEKLEPPSEPACPPSIETPAGSPHPLDEIVRVGVGPAQPDGGVGEVAFDVVVRDCNTQQRLQAIWLIEGDLTDGIPDIGVSGSTRRELSFRIPTGEFGGTGCKKVELRVAPSFNFLGEPVDPGDLGTAIWWAEVPSSDPTMPVTLQDCVAGD